MATTTPTPEQDAKLKNLTSQLAANKAEQARILSPEYQAGKTDAQQEADLEQLIQLEKQQSQLSRDQSTLAATAYGVDTSGTGGTRITTREGQTYNIAGTGVESRNTAASAEYSAKAYADKEIASQTAGPSLTRTETTSTTTVTGGSSRVTAMTPEMKAYTQQSSQALTLDSQAQKQAFLASQGLENADPGTQLKAITKARNQYDANGNSTYDTFKSTANQDAVGPPPAEQYTTNTIPRNTSGVQTPNDGQMTPDQAAKNSASGQTAEQQLQNNSTPDQQAESLSDEEKAKLDQSKSGELSSKVEQSQDPTASNQNQNAGADQKKSEANFGDEKTDNKADSVVGNKGVSGKKSDYDATTKKATIPQNKLHNYTSYTYRISLFLLTKQDYNNLATNPRTFVPTFSLISSGGGFATPGAIITETTRKQTPFGGYEDVSTTQTKSGRHPDFQTDFFIDNLSMTTIVGLNAKTKASNAVDISFNITEPYGLSLLDRLLSACETSGDRNTNYMEQPFLLQVDILASPTDEQLIKLNQTTNVIDTKRMAIKLLEMKIKPSGSGTTYGLKAIPYNHTAFSLSVASLPVAMTVEAGTVGEFFSSTDDLVRLFAGQQASEEERLEQNIKAWLDEFQSVSGYAPGPEQVIAQRAALKKAIQYNSTSLAAGYNGYMEKISNEQKLSKLPPTKIAFNIPDKAISSSPIVDATAQSSDGTMTPTTATPGAADPKYKKTQSFPLNPGTSILSIIDQVMGKSEYVKNQIQTFEKENNTNNEQKNYTNDNTARSDDKKSPPLLKWYKVIPTVALNDFDGSRNAYSKTILYSILPYNAANSYHPNFPKATTQTLSESVVREYNYLYTGKNQDVLKLDIDFDSTFYTQLTTYRTQVARLGSNKFSDPDDFSKTKFSTSANVQSTNPPSTVQYTGSNRDSNSMNSASNPTEQITADLKKSLYTSQRGDSLNIKLQITGDPDFIKQDDVFINPGSPDEYAKITTDRLPNSSAPITSAGQILFDAQQVYVRVIFKNAVDIDDKIGIVNKQEKLTNGRTTDGTFTGIYKVIQVDSSFSRGQFTQTLDLIRMPDVLPAVAVNTPKVTTAGVTTETNSSKQSAESDASKKSVISANPAGVAPTPQPKLVEAAAQPAVNNQAAPENANNAQNIAPQNTPGLTFPQAFAQARKDFGNKPGGSFEWRGKLYQTNYQNEPYVKNPKPVYPGAN